MGEKINSIKNDLSYIVGTIAKFDSISNEDKVEIIEYCDIITELLNEYVSINEFSVEDKKGYFHKFIHFIDTEMEYSSEWIESYIDSCYYSPEDITEDDIKKANLLMDYFSNLIEIKKYLEINK